MRQRSVKNVQAKLSNYEDLVVLNPLESLERIDNFVKKFPKVSLEIGMGKGNFIRSLTSENPKEGFIGLEKEPSVVYKNLLRTKKRDNLLYILGDARLAGTYFHRNSIDKIYLTFSDPWPKKRHYKRRLTFTSFLLEYKKILKVNGEIIFKSDAKDLYDFSLTTFIDNGFKIIKKSENFDSLSEGLPLTEYEEKFRKIGKNIYYIEVENGNI